MEGPISTDIRALWIPAHVIGSLFCMIHSHIYAADIEVLALPETQWPHFPFRHSVLIMTLSPSTLDGDNSPPPTAVGFCTSRKT